MFANQFFKMNKYLFIIVSCLLISCGGYQKLLKSNDIDLKFTEAKRYYQEGEYFKCLPLLDELHVILRGTDRAEEIDYLLAYTHYGLDAYNLASYHFTTFYKKYPSSKHSEELDFMAAFCFYLQSPKSSLDGGNTLQAIEQLQSFIDRNPDSDRVERCNELIDDLTNKLMTKAFEIARLYYDIEDYQAAITSFNNLVNDYPLVKNPDVIQFLILDSNFKLASNSVLSKKEERYNNTIASYYYFVDKFSSSEKIKEAQNIYDKSIKQLENFKK
jgi:outer membrane protein assembly factor BamD